jgi:hypothetical protein
MFYITNLKLTYYIFLYIFFETWYPTYYKVNKVHDDFIMILEEVLNLLSYLYIKNKVLQCQGIFLSLFLHTFSP